MNEERVEIFVPKGYTGDEPNVFVSVNGVNYLLPRGKKRRCGKGQLVFFGQPQTTENLVILSGAKRSRRIFAPN